MASNILETIRNDYQSYPRSSQAVAKVIIDQPERVLCMSIVELAQAAQVSDPTVVRFARRVGFEGYKDFKRELANELSAAEVRPVQSVADRVASPDDSLGSIMASYTIDLKELTSTVDEKNFSKAVEVLSKARKVEFWGQCTSSTLATDAYDKLFRAGVACVVSTEPNLQRLYSRQFDESDVIVAISHLGHNEDIARSIEQAQILGASVIAIATEDSIVANACKIPLATKKVEMTPISEMSMKAAHVLIVDALAVASAAAKERNLAAGEQAA